MGLEVGAIRWHVRQTSWCLRFQVASGLVMSSTSRSTVLCFDRSSGERINGICSDMTKSSLSFEDGGPVGAVPENLWNWMVNDFDLQAPAIVSLHQPASRLKSLCRNPDARNETPTEGQSAAEHLQWSYGQLKTAALRVAAFLSSHIRKQQSPGERQTVIVTFVRF